jgi:hypothetical protein
LKPAITNTFAAEHSGADLSAFRYHTGAQPTRLAPGEACPPLFRDVGVEAMARFLRGDLQRLCGPISPITYLRTADYREPYTDYGRIGRIMLLQPHSVTPWHSGIETVYIAPRQTCIDSATMVFIPGEIPLADAASQLAGARCLRDIAEAFGERQYEEARIETLARLHDLEQTHADTEQWAAPLRRLFQSMNQSDRDQAREWMQRKHLCESDLCTAWHHLPAERRSYIREALADGGEFR